jgi:peptide deformylase
MARLTILEFPDPRLRTRAQPVEQVDAALQTLIDDMFETMYAAPGIGLAATQVDVHRRFMVIDVSEGKDQPLVFINPEIVARDGVQTYQEGCLSVPGIYADVERADRITVRARDRHFQPFELQADGLLAICIQHEMDHLEGKVFVDYLSPFKREQVRKKLAKAAKEKAEDAAAEAAEQRRHTI